MLTVTVYYKDPHEQPDEEAQECGSVQVPVQEPLSLWTWNVPPSEHVDVFAISEAP